MNMFSLLATLHGSNRGSLLMFSLNNIPSACSIGINFNCLLTLSFHFFTVRKFSQWVVGELPVAGGVEGTLDGVQSLRLDHYYY